MFGMANDDDDNDDKDGDDGDDDDDDAADGMHWLENTINEHIQNDRAVHFIETFCIALHCIQQPKMLLKLFQPFLCRPKIYFTLHFFVAATSFNRSFCSVFFFSFVAVFLPR